MSSWEYRVVEQPAVLRSKEIIFKIEEVYFDKGKIVYFGDAPVPYGEDVEEISQVIALMNKATNKSVITKDDIIALYSDTGSGEVDKTGLLELIDAAIRDFNIGSYVEYDCANDYFDDALNREDILSEVEEIICKYKRINSKTIDYFIADLKNIELCVDEDVKLNKYTCFYKNAILGDRIDIDAELVKLYLLDK